MIFARLAAAAGIVLALTCVSHTQDKAPRFTAPNLDSITQDDLKADVYFLASDELKGRETTLPESDIAAAYIAGRYRKAGAKPGGENGGWYQTVEFAYNEYVEKPTIKVIEKNSADAKPSAELKFGEDFTVSGVARPLAATPMVFVGYAVTDAKKNWDDFAGVDVKGKVALLLRYEPSPWRQGGSLRGWSRNAFLDTKVALLKKAGAVGAIMVTGPASTNGLDNWSNMKAGSGEEKSPPLSLADDKPDDEGKGLPFYVASVKAVDRILGGDGKLKEIQEALDSGDRASNPDLSGITISVESKTRRVLKNGRNVVAKIEGERDEWVVLGGHYDHIGLGYFGAADARTAQGEIHNGADDNASGTSALIEIAEAFSKGQRPKRSFLFIAFTGEEKGLLGSTWYGRHPIVPHEKCLAMINIDMIGRVKNQRLEMFGTNTSNALNAIVRDVEPLFNNLKLRYHEEPVAPVSDMWAFYSAGLPVLFPFSGYNQEMHTAVDDPETINYAGLCDATRMIAEIAWRVSETEAYPDYKGPNKNAKGPDGRFRIPRKEEPKKPPVEEEKEEQFSR